MHLSNLFREIKLFFTLPLTPCVELVLPLHADVADRLATIHDQKTATVTENLNFRETIDDLRGVSSRQREVITLVLVHDYWITCKLTDDVHSG